MVAGSVYQIAHEARWRSWALFGLLVGIMLVCVVVVAVVVALFLRIVTVQGGTAPSLSIAANLGPIVLTVLVALLLAVLYWLVARIGARDRLVRMMHAVPLDPGDRFHQRLANIVEEMRLATGAPSVQCLTVPTVGMNAFTFSDLHGGACIGVTEGALSRLSREQLQGVVAHEFGHVLSGDYETATTACLLFGVYGGLADSLDSVGDDRHGGSLLAGVLRLLQGVSAVTNAALSREREWVADAAAAHYTRDPLSLAQALQMMIRHPGGGGYIPDAMSSLCIRPTDLNPSTWVARAMATHPPVDDRIGALLKLANVGWDQFRRQADTAEAVFEQQEHVTEAPGAATAVPDTERLTQVLAAPLSAVPVAPAPMAPAANVVATASAAPVFAPPASAPAVTAPTVTAATAAAPAVSATVSAPPVSAPQGPPPPAARPAQATPTAGQATPPAPAVPARPAAPARPAVQTAAPAGSAAVAPGAVAGASAIVAPGPGLLAPNTVPAAPNTAPAAPGSASSLRVDEVPQQAFRCPSCGAALESFDYEGASIYVCRSCAGRLATTSQVQRILTRREMRFDDRQQRIADYVTEHGDELRRDFVRRRGSGHATLITCPSCARTMVRRQYSYDEAVEVDYCVACDLFWFERDELEVLQVIIERRSQ